MTTEFDADVIVVGSGVCGSLTAHRLAQAGKNVILLEAGPRVPRWKLVEKFRNTPIKGNPNAPYPDNAYAPKSDTKGYIEETGGTKNNPSYIRLVGGTTWHWAGACYRFLPNDFKMQSLYGVSRDWPITYDDLEKYYGQAEKELGVSGNDNDDQSATGQRGPFPPRSTPYPMPAQALPYMQQRANEILTQGGFKVLNEPTARNSQPFDERPACQGNNSCTPVCPIGALYNGSVHAFKAEQRGVRLLTEAVVYKVEADGSGKITRVRYKSPDGTNHQLTARIFVLAAYSIETPRLLLMSGIANKSDMVGRNLSCQPESHQAFLAREALWPGRGPVHPQTFYTQRDGEFRRTIAGTKHVIGNNSPNATVTNHLLKQGIIGPRLDEMIRDHAARFMELSTQHEYPGDPNNRITLSTTRKDALGLPTPVVHFNRDHPYFLAGFEQTKQVYRRVAELFGATEFSPLTWVHPHTQGTTIMGADPHTSVVDAVGRTHDHPNLYIVGPSVMATTGTVNPTLTAAALALRTADAVLHSL
ncbi:choline dehydrogenase [Herbaspirillum rubrisubalbicans]|uniref:GMC family oxidoreductase n=1 Tax=Herbaspirillum rubrisubalbicans TaxID=80842 RepID=UPI000DC4C1C7|nr:GMC family oxidoreductase [Herbaspirillum rubrisubalbicans]RAN50069.1 choline dehydrogenase [Herbaspirillum rubrisubalbicans]